MFKLKPYRIDLSKFELSFQTKGSRPKAKIYIPEHFHK